MPDIYRLYLDQMLRHEHPIVAFFQTIFLVNGPNQDTLRPDEIRTKTISLGRLDRLGRRDRLLFIEAPLKYKNRDQANNAFNFWFTRDYFISKTDRFSLDCRIIDSKSKGDHWN